MSNRVVFFSDLYRVEASENGQARVLPVYQSLMGHVRMRDAEPIELDFDESISQEFNGLGASTKCRAKTTKTYYTCYTFKTQVSLAIVLPENVRDVKIKPDAAAAHVTVDGNCVRVTTDRTLYFVIEPDGEPIGGLRVFLDRAKEAPAQKKHVIAFTDGIYTAESSEYIHLDENGTPVIDGIEDDTLIYIGKDAIVNAAIVLKGVKNVEIAGTGILTTLNRCHGAENGFDGTHFWGLFRENAVPNVYIRSGCEQIVVRDILIDSEFRGIIIRNSRDVRIENVKIFASTQNADGINCYNTSDLSVDGCFIQSNDDCFCLYNSCDSIPWLHDEGYDSVVAVCRNVEFKNCILLTHCRPFVFGGHATGAKEPRCLIENFHIHDVDIIGTLALLNPNEKFAFYWTSVFRLLSQSEQIVRGLVFENVTVDVTDGYCGKIFHLHVRPNSEASYTESRGYAIENVVFRNITVRGSLDELYPSVIICRAAEDDETDDVPHIANVTFEGVTLGDRPICESDLRVEGNVKNLQLI